MVDRPCIVRRVEANVTTESSDSAGKICCLLSGHRGKVNCVRWIECPFVEETGQLELRELVSGSQDGVIIVWRRTGTQYQQHARLTGHTGAVTAVEAVHLPDSDGQLSPSSSTLVASVSGDSTVKLWQRADIGGEFSCQQSIALGSGFALDVALHVLPGTSVPLLVLGGDDMKLHFYQEAGGHFTKCLSLGGHEDWIRGVEITADDNGDLLVASCAQDCFIRLWRVVADHSRDAKQDDGELRLKGNKFQAAWEGDEAHFSVVLESVLAGHEQWVYGLHWHPATYKDGRRHQEPRLLSASMDKTMIVWKLDSDSGVWLDHVRVGEVGGNTLGLFGCQFGPDGNAILAHGYQGAFHLWKKAISNPDSMTDQWFPVPVVSGHYAGVQDIVWEPENGEFLMSVGLDQTTRLHAPWQREGFETTWHEIARPQVHGYDMQCLTLVNQFQLASGADEKVVRVFEAPRNFIENFGRISDVDVSQALKDRKESDIPEGASVPALGLSNKAVFQGEAGMPTSDREISHPSEMYPEIYFNPLELAAPPTEEHLLQNTLWPETQKLYGHSYEIFSIASHPNGSLVASACKASKPEYATVILWDTTSWRQLGQLAAHSLTVTQLAFSHSGRHLLAVSRDRTWSLFQERKSNQQPGTGCPYTLVACTDKKTSIHTRIIWSCSWSHDDRYFATASRDKKVIVWGQRSSGQDGEAAASGGLGNYQACSAPVDLKDSVTAVDFAPTLSSVDGSYIIAVGLDSGAMSVLKWNSEKSNGWQTCFRFPTQLCHTATVKRLRWRPKVRGEDKGQDGRSQLALASCGADGSVRIHSNTHNSL
ncbi:elongator complex protein 2-like isoform X2 [Acanthaster planci]|uniref:Elongator complex protein 2 n=1 Tax=Acanthaster planci TaxID=133434 RepID=A0A8B7YU44_ACAPL|nr:elongator complex protein 2-like isoform X2 [Acanthaster planci]